MKPIIAIIGGTGVNQENIFTDIKDLTIDNEYGTAVLKSANYNGSTLIFLERHGKGHSLAPHEINYRANIKALKDYGVERIIATAAVGGINKEYAPGDFVIIDDFLDFTKSRKSTFFENTNNGVVHIDVSEPYCNEIRSHILHAGSLLNINMYDKGTYVCTEGPRFETRAEIKAFSYLGGDVVGMTNVPEVILANELEICYATITIITNYAAGISKTPLTHREVLKNMDNMSAKLSQLILSTIDELPDERNCNCKKK